MISASDLAKQINLSKMQQNAAEEAFKAKFDLGSSDAFQHVFDRLSAEPVKVPHKNDAAEPAKAPVAKKVDHDQDHSAVSDHGDDKASVSRHDDAPIKKAARARHANEAKKDDASSDDVFAADTRVCTTNTTAAQTALIEGTAVNDSSEITSEAAVTTDDQTVVTATAQQAVVVDAPIDEKAVDVTITDKKQTPFDQADSAAITINPLIAAQVQHNFLNANIAPNSTLTANLDMMRKANAKLAELGAHKMGKEALSDDSANFANGIDGSAKDASVDDGVNALLVKKDAIKEAKSEHADLMELLQGKS
ncbi:MAG: hypothetical protein EB059_07670, partial [Alphaproteobacteria bacterium]|nr:hypothetical protein [Alphaproteobacteria bacterium]